MRFRWFFTSVAVVCGVALLLLALAELGWWRQRYNVIVLTVESARAEVLSPETTPHIWRAAEQGVRFESHRAVSGWTAANIVSLLSGLTPFAHGIHGRDQHVPADWPLPLKDLATAGYKAAGLQPFQLVEGFRALGLDIEPGANLVAWLARQTERRQPFVLWYHYLDTHLPYAPPEAYRPDPASLVPADDHGARARLQAVMTMPAIVAGSVPFEPSDRAAIHALYLAGFRAFDAWFGNLWHFIEASGLRENTIVVLTADHGEEILERGQVGHASTTRAGHLHEEIVRIPLVIWVPPSFRAPPAGAIKTPSAHTDVMPTLLALLGRKASRELPGRDLFSSGNERPWLGLTSGAGFAEPEPFNIPRFVGAIADRNWKLHVVRDHGVDRDISLYDLESDPAELINLADRRPDIVNRLRDLLVAHVLSMRLSPAPGAGSGDAAAPSPRWIFPATSGSMRYDDVSGRFRLEWSGDASRVYRVQYEAGRGTLSLRGEFDVQGTIRDFGTLDRRYWNTWVVPYELFRLRVGVAGRDDRWSEWLDLRPRP